MDFETLFLSVECGTIEDDEAKIWPISFELKPISELSSDYGPNHEDIDRGTGKKIATVQYTTSGIRNPPLYIDIGDNNGKLAAYRMQILLFILETLTACNRHGNPILRFKAPIGMDVGERWEMHRLEQWIEVFNGVISF
jgi:hypothetical protein